MQNRAVWKVIIFGLITLGIYDIYWLYKTRLELVARGNKIPRVINLFIPFFTFLLALGLLMATRSATSDDIITRVVNILTILIVCVSVLALMVIPFIWFYQYSKAVHNVTNGTTSLTLSYLLWILMNFVGVSFVWPGIIQDGFNNNTGAPHPGVPAAPPQTMQQL